MTPEQTSSDTLLQVENLSLDVLTENGRFPLISRVSFRLNRGRVLGIVGESGSGKTVTCLSLTRLLPQPPIFYREGTVRFTGQDLWQMSERELRRVRGTGIGVIFQDALNALNPVQRVGEQVDEIFKVHQHLNPPQAREQTLKLFRQVGIPSAEKRYFHYPHQLSGGLQQRVMIAIALAGGPQLLIADEPTTALDVTIQVQIIELLKRLQKERRMSIIFVSHDLGLIAEICDDVLVMYAGERVEYSPVKTLFREPAHPYTQLLLKSIPHLNAPRGQLVEIPGQVPSPAQYPTGCRFHPRCPYADEQCRQASPEVLQISPGHTVKCWHPQIANK